MRRAYRYSRRDEQRRSARSCCPGDRDSAPLHGRGADLERRDGRGVPRARRAEPATRVAVKRLLDMQPRGALRDRGAPAGAAAPPARRARSRLLPGRRAASTSSWSSSRAMDLGEVLKRARQPRPAVDDAIEYVRQACEALQYVHDQQIVHRDVKPQNLIRRRRAASCWSTSASRASWARRTTGHGRHRHAALHGARGVRRRRRSRRAQRRLRPRRDALDADRRQAARLRRPDASSRSSSRASPTSSRRRSRAGLEMIPERRVASVRGVRQGARRPAARQRRASRSR